MSTLPSGLTARPLTVDDAAAVHAVMAAQELADVGAVEIEVEDLLADWQRPSHDLGASSVAVLEDGVIVAYAEVTGHDRYDCAVHPDVRGRGLGTWLAAWSRDLARSRGSARLGMPVPEGSPGDRLLAALGYEVRWTSWVLRLPLGTEVPHRPLPEGYEVREAAPEHRQQVWTVLEDAFLEWSDRERQTFDDLAAQVWLRPSFEPWHLRVVLDPAGDVVAVAHAWNAETAVPGTAPEDRETYVSRLATRGDQRGRGLAQALLADTFATGRARGAVTGVLGTDSRTGALGLYEKVGMVVDSVWLNRCVELDAAR